MKITVINNRASTGNSVPCVDGTSVAPGDTKVMTGRSKEEVAYQMDHADGNTVIVIAQIEGVDRAPLVCDMKNPADPAVDGTTVAACGFDLEDADGTAANVAPQMYLGAFDDEACTTPAANATLDTAAAGTIDDGAGTNLLKVTPSATGEVSVTLTDATPETVYLKAWPVGTGYIIDASETDAITFTAS